MNAHNLQVLTNIIGAVESGGQVYGKRRYDQYSPPYHSTPKEHTITIGWYCGYGHEAKQLIQAIFDTDTAAFRKLDTCSPSIESMLSKDWVSIKWNPSSKQKDVIIKLIDSKIGHECQDKIFAAKCKVMAEQCVELYPGTKNNIKAQMMFAEIKHLGGLGPVKRIFNRLDGDYSLDAIMASLVKDQNDKSSSNQVGDKIFWSRHVKCRQYIDQYSVPEDGAGAPKKPEEQKKEESKTMAYDPQKVINVAMGEVGYMEKKSNSSLDDKAANAGSGNYTKYWRDMKKSYQGEAWCDCFVGWCFVTAYGREVAEKLQCGGTYSFYTPTSAQYYKNKKQWYSSPKIGDQAFFKNSTRICHTGIVYDVKGGKVYTVEGNAGNKVQKKSYALSDGYIAGFGRPNYGMDAVAPVEPSVPSAPTLTEKVAAYQKFLNANYAQILKTAGVGQLVVDGDYGTKSRAASVAVWKFMAKKYYGASLTIGNSNFLTSCKAVAAKMTDEEIAKHPTLAQIKNGVIAGRGFNSVTDFQKAKGINANGKMNAETWYSLFN